MIPILCFVFYFFFSVTLWNIYRRFDGKKVSRAELIADGATSGADWWWCGERSWLVMVRRAELTGDDGAESGADWGWCVERSWLVMVSRAELTGGRNSSQVHELPVKGSVRAAQNDCYHMHLFCDCAFIFTFFFQSGRNEGRRCFQVVASIKTFPRSPGHLPNHCWLLHINQAYYYLFVI